MSNSVKVELKKLDKGTLVRFNKRGDVYKILYSGFMIQLQNMYTNRITRFKSYTLKGGQRHERTVEVVDFY